MPSAAAKPLNILHVLRAPVGGLFRHVVDLARGQTARGHRVGLVADSSTGGEHADAVLAQLAEVLALGVTRVPMSRQIGLRDAAAVSHVTRTVAEVSADVVHGHGAKGSAYARLAGVRHAIRVYTPHGGSLHYRWHTPTGCVYLALERILMRRTDLFLFESAYGREVFTAKIGNPGAAARVVHNGVTAAEFAAVAPDPAATDMVFVGELRQLKGIDVLVGAIAVLAREGHRLSVTIAGEGPDRDRLESQVKARHLDGLMKFVGALPARAAFARGRLLAVPSRAESLPYIVLEAAAAGLPMVATRVGGIPEIFGPDSDALIAPGDPAALAAAIARARSRPAERQAITARLRARVQAQFSADAMTEAVLAAYRERPARPDG